MIGLFIIVVWAVSLLFNFLTPAPLTHPFTYLRILVQMHLFTGLFITAHDAMHGAVHPKNPTLNHGIGKLAATLFLFNAYQKMRPKHYAHHRHVATEQDPDYHKGHPQFFRWYFDFLREYISWKQLLLAALAFNLLKLPFPEQNVIMFWVLPSLLSTFQLFYFGTFLPHRGEHAAENKHKSRSQRTQHLLAFLACYFFGYHYEHHDQPQVPWWRLWRIKEQAGA